MTRYLTKSRFQLANQCPTKLFYTQKAGYHDTGVGDEFLSSLAEGGHQVGSLAKALFRGGQEVQVLDPEQALAETEALLEQENVVLFEPAFRYGTLLVRVDILEKRGDTIRLIEVKAKSCRGVCEAQFLNKRKADSLRAEFAPYLKDVAFQHHVVSLARPDWRIQPEIMLVDKGQTCPTNGLHQKFLMKRDPETGRGWCEQTAELTSEEVDGGLLVAIPLRETLRVVREACRYGADKDMEFAQWIDFLAARYSADERIWTHPGKHCGDCRFRVPPGTEVGDRTSGFDECWQHSFGLTDEQLEQPTVLELWNGKSKELLAKGRHLLGEIRREDLGSPRIGDGPMGHAERQWLQVLQARDAGRGHELRRGLKPELEKWKYPLHFIDFETMQPAIPMHTGCHPYEQIAFQYSHHVVHADGRIEHAGDWIEDRRGEFPNFAFVRALRSELEGDEGTILRFAAHENTILCAIRDQLRREQDRIENAGELITFIESVARPTGKYVGEWTEGTRGMADMCDLVKKYYLDPRMRGSNSIKQVLPAVLQTSTYLREKYSRPIYGATDGIPSRNFRNQAWVELDADGQVRDPYKLLPPLFEDFDPQDAELLLCREGSVDNGGAAMTTYARMQYGEMSAAERKECRGKLLMYCELDTLAMVMIWEAWRDWL